MTMKAADLFAGLGGFSEGARRAGVHVAWAANHWKQAVDVHAQAHPTTEHACQDLQQFDFYSVPPCDLLLASPACQGHSRAKGKEKPRHDPLRATAWAVISAMEAWRPAAAIIENVPEFVEWELFPSWADAAQRLGYTLRPHMLDTADFGVPQSRPRVFITAVRARSPLVLNAPAREHVPVSTVLSFDDRHQWTPSDKLGDATRARLQRGAATYGERFVAPYYSNGSGLTGRSIDRPIGTLRTNDCWRVARNHGEESRLLAIPEWLACMGFREDYPLPRQSKAAKMMIGNAVSPVQAADLIAQVVCQL